MRDRCARFRESAVAVSSDAGPGHPIMAHITPPFAPTDASHSGPRTGHPIIASAIQMATTVGDRVMSYPSVRPGHCIAPDMWRDRLCFRM
jgi:hypothetical protein